MAPHQSSSSNESDNNYQITIHPQPLKLKKPHQPNKEKKTEQEHQDNESWYLEGLVSGSRYREGLVSSESQYFKGLVFDSRYRESLISESRYLEGLVSNSGPGNMASSPKRYSGKLDNNNNNTHGQTPSSASKVEIASSLNNNANDGEVREHQDSGRERLKRHRVEVAGRVWIPDIWGQEELLKDWIDSTAFDAPLVPSRVVMARTALVEEGRRATSSGFSIENRC